MGPQLLARLEPEDVVQDVWAQALPKLPELTERAGRHTPVVLRYLSTSVLHRINNLLRTRMTDPHADDPLSKLPEATRGPLSRAVQGERRGLVLRAIDELGERDRELVLLRALEQHSNAEAAERMGIDPNTAAQAYRRALGKLREKLPGSVFAEL
jgi:RNA polymerase sigma factor (sigma-70 family)